MIKENKKTPEIRFPGFTEDWEQRKLGEVFEFQYGEFNNNPDNGGEYPIYGANGIIGGYTDWNAENSSIIGHMGAYAGYVVWGEGKHFVTYNGTIARPKDNSIDSKYGYYLLDSKKIYKICAGSGQPFVSYSDLNGIDILMPKDKDEQRLLAYYFSNLDNLITLHQRKCDALQILKKSMLQKMFPKKGSSVPEIRFPGFTEDWEQRKFGEIVQTRRGLTYKPTDIQENGIRVLRSSNIDEDKFVYGNDDVFVNPGAVNIETVKQNDILITSANGSSRLVGKHTLIKEIPNDSAVHGGFMLLGRTKNFDFINASMSSSWYERFINIFVAGVNGAIGNLNKNDLDEQIILVPIDAEQQKIGEYFHNLDTLITLHQRKCDTLKELKKGMLQKMFV